MSNNKLVLDFLVNSGSYLKSYEKSWLLTGKLDANDQLSPSLIYFSLGLFLFPKGFPGPSPLLGFLLFNTPLRVGGA